MKKDTKTILEKQLSEARKEVAYYRSLSQENGRLRLRETEELSKLISKIKEAEANQRKLEERLQHAEKMEALGLLAGGVAHDLNNVLGALTGYSELLLQSTEESDPVNSYAAHILKASGRAAAIIQDMLALTKNRLHTRRIVNLNNVVMDYLNKKGFAKLSVSHPNIRTRIKLETELLNIMGCPVQLGKIIMNLVSNAAESMPGGGLLTIKTLNQCMHIPAERSDGMREGEYVLLSVSDEGEGIAAEDLKRIFEPFYTKKIMGRSGTGLELAEVWGTVKEHQGYIDVQSTVGKGSSFNLHFPVTEEIIAPECINDAPIPRYMGHGESILVVDDV